MAFYVIGDVQGCYDDLQRLLDKIRFDFRADTLWFTGDLVNRGPKSVETLRFVKALGRGAVTVLGNHDLHMLAVAENTERYRSKDTFSDVFNAPDADELLDWLRGQPLLHFDEARNILLVHAGLDPAWDIAEARALAAEVEAALRGEDYHRFFECMYGNEPDRWDRRLSGWDRLRFVTNTFTRLRYCDHEGHQILDSKGPVGTQPEGYEPWFQIERRRSKGTRIVFGHWAALGAARHGGEVYSVDSGCGWGGALTALRLEPDVEFVCVKCDRKAVVD